jgi:hypothetical protein
MSQSVKADVLRVGNDRAEKLVLKNPLRELLLDRKLHGVVVVQPERPKPKLPKREHRRQPKLVKQQHEPHPNERHEPHPNEQSGLRLNEQKK